MTKVKLVNGTIFSADKVEIVNGTLQITVIDDVSVEDLADAFSDKYNTCHITLLTESGKESGFKVGFTSFEGIMFNADCSKTVQMFQPKDVTEERISHAEGLAIEASKASIAAYNSSEDAKVEASYASDKADAAIDRNEVLAETLDNLLTEVIPGMMAV